MVLVLVADDISSWSLVRSNEVWLVDFEGQEALVSLGVSFRTAVSHFTVRVTELVHLADLIQENRGLQRVTITVYVQTVQSIVCSSAEKSQAE